MPRSELGGLDQWDVCGGQLAVDDLRYVNPLDGGWAMPTMATMIRLLPRGFATQPYRSSDSSTIAIARSASSMRPAITSPPCWPISAVPITAFLFGKGSESSKPLMTPRIAQMSSHSSNCSGAMDVNWLAAPSSRSCAEPN